MDQVLQSSIERHRIQKLLRIGSVRRNRAAKRGYDSLSGSNDGLLLLVNLTSHLRQMNLPLLAAMFEGRVDLMDGIAQLLCHSRDGGVNGVAQISLNNRVIFLHRRDPRG